MNTKRRTEQLHNLNWECTRVEGGKLAYTARFSSGQALELTREGPDHKLVWVGDGRMVEMTSLYRAVDLSVLYGDVENREVSKVSKLSRHLKKLLGVDDDSL